MILPRRSSWRGRAGYTLLEVLIVLTIIGLIAAVVGPQLLSQLDRSKVSTARVQARALSSALQTMYLDIGRYPTEAEGLGLLVNSQGVANWAGPYLEHGVPLDPWRHAYEYVEPGTNASPTVKSLGADGREGGAGNNADVSSDT